MRHLTARMDPLIGAPAAMQFDGLAGQLPEGIFETGLHRGPMGLNLPSKIVRPLIGNHDPITLHYSCGSEFWFLTALRRYSARSR